MKVHQHHAASIIATSAPVVDAHLQTVAVTQQDMQPKRINDDNTGFQTVLVMLALLYFIPSIVAYKRQHHNRSAIIGLNIMLGWSVLGWIAALVWALTVVEKVNHS